MKRKKFLSQRWAGAKPFVWFMLPPAQRNRDALMQQILGNEQTFSTPHADNRKTNERTTAEPLAKLPSDARSKSDMGAPE
jgi:hypothetical protein